MNHPWLAMRDWPVSALDGNDAKKSAFSATSCTVVNSPSMVSAPVAEAAKKHGILDAKEGLPTKPN
jgi:alkylhydroperoxidase family enzyme